MNSRLLNVLLAVVLQPFLFLPAFAGQDSTKLEHDKKIDFEKVVELDDTDKEILLEHAVIWEPFSLEAPSCSGVSGALDSEGNLCLAFTPSLGACRVEIYRQGQLVLESAVSGAGEESLPVGDLSPGVYVILLLPEEEEGTCYVGRFRLP